VAGAGFFLSKRHDLFIVGSREPGSRSRAPGPGLQGICRYFAQKHGVNQFLYQIRVNIYLHIQNALKMILEALSLEDKKIPAD